MEGFGNYLEFARFVAAGLGDSSLTLLDVGCSGGIDAGWRGLGDRLRAFAFDPNLQEIERLRQAETNPAVRYWQGFVVAPPDDPIARARAGRDPVSRNPWSRLAVAATIEFQAASTAQLSNEEKTAQNAWTEVELAAPTQDIVLPEFIREHCFGAIDFVKIDIDGNDFKLLHSLSDLISGCGILGFGLEINYIGSEDPTEHSFHNTDRFMRTHRFDLFHLTVRHYSNRSLPSKYLYSVPAQSLGGRPLQGDALYLKDICAEENRDFAATLSPEKKLKLSVIYSLFGLPDCAAEILNIYQPQLAPLISIEEGLELLVIQAQDLSGIRAPSGGYMTYREFIEAFRSNSPAFYRALM